jgi:hypothetical protein
MATDVMIQLGTGGSYRITCGDDHSDSLPLGEGIEWKAPNGKLYIAFCDLEGGAAESDTVESMFEHYVYEAKPVAAADVMEEEFDEGGDEEGEEGDDDEEEGEGEPTE